MQIFGGSAAFMPPVFVRVGLESFVIGRKDFVRAVFLHNASDDVERHQPLVVIAEEDISEFGVADNVLKRAGDGPHGAEIALLGRVVPQARLALKPRRVVAGDGFEDVVSRAVLPRFTARS